MFVWILISVILVYIGAIILEMAYFIYKDIKLKREAKKILDSITKEDLDKICDNLLKTLDDKNIDLEDK